MSNPRRRPAESNVIEIDEPFVIDTAAPAPSRPSEWNVLDAYQDSLAPDTMPEIADDHPDTPGTHTTTTGGKVTVVAPFEIEGDPNAEPSTSDAIRETLTSQPIETLEERTRRNDRTAHMRDLAQSLAQERAHEQALADMRARQPEGVDDEDIAGPTGAFVRSAVRTLPFVGSFTDEAAGAVRTVGDLARGRIEATDIPARYARNRDAERYIQDRADLEHGDASFAGSATGILGQVFGLGATPVGKAMSEFVGRGATAADRLRRGAALSFTLGGAEGLGSSRAPLLSLETAKQTLGHAGTAALINLPIQGGLEGLTWLANRVSPSSVQGMARQAASKLASVQEGEPTADIARRMLATEPTPSPGTNLAATVTEDTAPMSGAALRRAALEGERGLDDLAQQGATAHGRFLDASEEILGGTVHDQMKRAELARRFAQAPASPDAVARSVEEMQGARSALEVFTGPEYPQGLRRRAREAIMQIDALEGQTSAFDLMDPEGMAHAYGVLDNAKRSIGRAYSGLIGNQRPGMTLPSSSPYKAFERAYEDIRTNLENPEIWGEAATELQRRVNRAWAEYLPHAERLSAMAEEGVERSASSPFAQRSVASGRAWSDIAQNAGRWEDQVARDALREGVRSGANLATTLDEAYLGGRSSQAAGQMNEAAAQHESLLSQMEIQGRARDELRQLANVSVRGWRVDQLVRALAQAEAVEGAAAPGLQQIAATMSGGRAAVAKAANAARGLRTYMQGSNATAEGALRYLSSVTRDPEVMQAVQATMAPRGSDATSPDSSSAELQPSDFADGAPVAATDEDDLLHDEDFAN